jgi:hypothetical protein
MTSKLLIQWASSLTPDVLAVFNAIVLFLLLELLSWAGGVAQALRVPALQV